MTIQNGISKKLTLSTLLESMDSYRDININPAQSAISFSVFGASSKLLFCDGINDRIGVKTVPTADFHVGGSIKSDGVFIGSSEIVQHPTGSPSVDASISTIVETSGLSIYGSSTYTLSSGTNGQTKVIYISEYQSGASATISVDDGMGFTEIVFSSNNTTPAHSPLGYGVILKFIGNKWVCVGSNNAKLQ